MSGVHKVLAASILSGALALFWALPPSECHPGHCPGPAVCGGGWKDYKQTQQHLGPEGGADTADDACSEAIEELEEQLAVQAHSRCKQLHPCAECTGGCTGCEQENPMGSLGDESTRSQTPRQGDDGDWQCAVSAEVVFRCRCGYCKE